MHHRQQPLYTVGRSRTPKPFTLGLDHQVHKVSTPAILKECAITLGKEMDVDVDVDCLLFDTCREVSQPGFYNKPSDR